MRQRLRPSSRRCAKATARGYSLSCSADLSERKLTIRVLPSGSMLSHMHHSSSSMCARNASHPGLRGTYGSRSQGSGCWVLGARV